MLVIYFKNNRNLLEAVLPMKQGLLQAISSEPDRNKSELFVFLSKTESIQEINVGNKTNETRFLVSISYFLLTSVFRNRRSVISICLFAVAMTAVTQTLGDKVTKNKNFFYISSFKEFGSTP